jgi:hypothetical protein
MPTGVITVAGVISYLGQLFQTSKRPNTFLKLLGGLQGGIQTTTGIEFPVGVFYALRAPSQPARLEGADAPTPEYRTISQATNVIQIFQEAVSASYLAQSDKTLSGPISLPLGGAQGQPINPRDPAWQVMAALETIAQDANYSFLRGAYQKPADPASTALKTRGLLTALSTNVLDKSADAVSATDPAKQVRGYINQILQTVITANGYNPDGTWVALMDPATYGTVIGAYEVLPTNRTELTRDVAGMKIRQIYTRFGILNMALDPDMPANEIAILNMGVAGIVGLPIEGKGVLFEEMLAKTGSTDKSQIYGQMGVDHGPEYCHGVITIPAGFSL